MSTGFVGVPSLSVVDLLRPSLFTHNSIGHCCRHIYYYKRRLHRRATLHSFPLCMTNNKNPGEEDADNTADQGDSNNPKGKDNNISGGSNKSNSSPPSFSTGRLNEWTSFSGDSRVQNNLASELQWAVQKVGTTQRMNDYLEHELDRTSKQLQDMYTRGERIITERNEGLVLKLSVSDIERWNEVVREGNKACREMRREIGAELEIVEKLLKASSKKNSLKRNGKGKMGRGGRRGGGERNEMKVRELFLVSSVLSTFGLHLFHTVAKQDNGTQNLIRFGLWSSLPILLLALITQSGSVSLENNSSTTRAKSRPSIPAPSSSSSVLDSDGTQEPEQNAPESKYPYQ